MPVSIPSSLFLTRHGFSEHNLNTRFFVGRAPQSRLTERGREQARRLGDRLASDGRVRHVVASSLPRTAETAQIIATRLGIATIHTDDGFWDLSKGEWEGRMPRDGVPPEVRERIAADPLGFQYPGGESLRQVELRAIQAYRRWAGQLGRDGVLFVLHADVIYALLHHLVGYPDAEFPRFEVSPCSLTELAAQGDGYRLVRFNEPVAE